MADASPLILADRLSRHFGDVRAVRSVSFEVSRGEVVGLLGPNGAGKSTTMKVLSGTLQPTAGSVSLGGIDLLGQPLLAKRTLGYAPEQPPLYGEFTVDEFLRFAGSLRGLTGKALRAAVERARERCGLSDAGGRLINNLSKGYRQRVGIAQAIVHHPAIVLLDEPSSGLDPNQMREIRTLVRELGDEHCVMLSTHMLSEVRSVCDRAIIMRDGQIVLDESLESLEHGESHRHVLHLRSALADGADPWGGLAGVVAVEPLDAHRARISHDGKPATLDAILDAARPLGVTGFVPERRDLEQLFVSLTLGRGSGDVEAGAS